MQPLTLLQLESTPIHKQLQLEEKLLKEESGNWCLINRKAPPAVVLGVSSPIDEVDAACSIPIVRRFSAGGTVVIDEETLFVTLICNATAIPHPSFPQSVLKWTEELYRPVFDRPDFRVDENDYVFGTQKFGGNAQYFTKGRWLHHTSFLWNYKVENMNLLKMPSKTPKYRQGRSHNQFLCRLQEFYPSQEFLLSRLHHSLSKYFLVNPA